MIIRIAAVSAALGAGPVLAAPNPQLLAQIEHGLARYHLSADLERLTTSEAAQLHLTLVAPEGFIRTRQKLKAILRQTEERSQ